jgi:hypothetical protein
MAEAQLAEEVHMETIVQGQKPRDRLGPTALAIAVMAAFLSALAGPRT